jgi:pimeloyl-ACP methyl ester carboxylesterase
MYKIATRPALCLNGLNTAPVEPTNWMIMFPSTLLHFLCFVCIAQAYSCIDFNAPITVTAPSYIPSFKEFGSHFDSVQFLVDLTTRVTEGTASPFSGVENVTEIFSIDASFCTRDDAYGEGQDVQILTHGVGFDKSYWDFGGQDSGYNYVRAATNAGYATLHWSRPGTGKSSSGNPYNILQADIQAAVLIEITKQFLSGELYAGLPKPTGRTLHVGHSFGSVMSNALIVRNPELSDGVVLTGFSHNKTFGYGFPTSTLFHLAKEIRPDVWGNYSTGVLAWGDELGLQYAFLKYPYFEPEVLAAAEATQAPFAVSELLTLWNPSLIASNFTGPVLVSMPV